MSDVHLPPGSSGSPLLDQIRAERPALRRALWTLPKGSMLIASDTPPPPSRKQLALIREPPLPSGSPLDTLATFDEFVVGERNQLAFIEAQRCAMALRPPYNPLYLYGATGLGKTHLLQAIAHADRRTIYLTAPRSIYQFLRPSDADDFRLAMRGVHILVIDDLQFLRNLEVSLLVGCFLESGRQLVVAADRPPRGLDRIDERNRSRLSGGLCIEVGGLNEALRVKLLENRIARAHLLHPEFEVHSEVIGYIASVFRSSVRDLDGAANRLLAHFLLHRSPLSIESAEEVFANLAPEKKIRIEEIQKMVSSHFEISVIDMISTRRTIGVVRPRQIAMYLSKVLTPRSLPEIARRFGGRDHTTVLHAVRRIAGLVKTDSDMAKTVATLKEMLLK